MTEPNSPERISIDEAEFDELKAFAELFLGIEVKVGTNAKQLRARILTAAPNTTDIPRLTTAPVVSQAPALTAEPAPEVSPASTSAPKVAQRYSPMRPDLDPKVTLRFHKTDDKRRSREITGSVNGYVCRYRRGEPVTMPYRMYRQFENAKEMAAVETDEINPVTGQPIIGWEEVYSYPFSIIEMPSDEEIAAWNEACKGGFSDRAPAAREAA